MDEQACDTCNIKANEETLVIIIGEETIHGETMNGERYYYSSSLMKSAILFLLATFAVSKGRREYAAAAVSTAPQQHTTTTMMLCNSTDEIFAGHWEFETKTVAPSIRFPNCPSTNAYTIVHYHDELRLACETSFQVAHFRRKDCRVRTFADSVVGLLEKKRRRRRNKDRGPTAALTLTLTLNLNPNP